VKALGKRSASVAVKASPFALLIMTIISSPNSIRLCLHMPQGATGSSVSATTARASKSLSPSLTAFAIAALSAQMAAPLEAF